MELGPEEEDQEDWQVDGAGWTERGLSRQVTKCLSSGVPGDAIDWDGEEVVAVGGRGVGLEVHVLDVC